MLELLSFTLTHPLCMPGFIIIINRLLIPWEYLGLCNAAIITLWSIFLFPGNRPYVDADFDYFGDIFIFSLNFLLLMGIVALIAVRLPEKGVRKQSLNKLRQKSSSKLRQEPKNISRNAKVLKFLSLLVYGILAAYFSFLLLTDLWYSYQPAWQAYMTIITVVIVATLSYSLIDKYADRYRLFHKLKDLSTFIYSFVSSIIIILFANIAFSIIARQETKKVIQEIGDRYTRYCIQVDRKPINSWLNLTPLTAWSKPNGNLGAGIRHAVLVIEKQNKHILYHWSYKLRKWEFNSVGFEPGAFLIPSSLECTPKVNYSDKLPFLF